ncbi:MAG TPA: hypothetical protein VF665_25460 [Longimicrobium sp.]|uniref:hypothetical protein n=1 Tax=Longimicrobium sp. TaxID=2029185 RepID=UPI002ED872C1
MKTVVLLAFVAVAAAIAPRACGAQGHAESTRSAARQMRIFLESLQGDGDEHPTAYLPAEGDWTWVHTVHHP